MDMLLKTGTLTFQKIGDMLFFSDISLYGFSADILGAGFINLKNSSIREFALQIRTLKDVSSLIKNIPILGYIILGKDKSIYTNVEISGTSIGSKNRDKYCAR